MAEEQKDLEFDWETEHSCEYEIPAYWQPEGVTDCGEAAAYHGMWYNEDGELVDSCWLCQEHWLLILRGEREKRV